MKRFLTLVSQACFCGGFGMVAAYFAAMMFVMRDQQIQEFILLNGPEMIVLPLAACLVIDRCLERLKSTQVPGRDSLVFGLGASFLFVGSTFAYIVARLPWISVRAVWICIGLAIFGFILSAAFHFKDEESMETGGLKEQSGP